MTQQDFSAFGVHPTCSVSTISSGPADPLDPSDLKQETRTQYVIPGSKSTASPATSLPSLWTERVVVLAPAVQSCSIFFHSNSYLSIDETGLNWTEMVVCGVVGKKYWLRSEQRENTSAQFFCFKPIQANMGSQFVYLWYYLATKWSLHLLNEANQCRSNLFFRPR